MALLALHDLPAPAKLNAFLHVVGRRDDGYHLLESAMLPIDWCDVLHVERRTDGRLARHDLGVALPADDLCLRAARALQQESGTPFGADVSIDKRVPWGAAPRRARAHARRGRALLSRSGAGARARRGRAPRADRRAPAVVRGGEARGRARHRRRVRQSEGRPHDRCC
jgi:hypothetical protein